LYVANPKFLTGLIKTFSCNWQMRWWCYKNYTQEML